MGHRAHFVVQVVMVLAALARLPLQMMPQVMPEWTLNKCHLSHYSGDSFIATVLFSLLVLLDRSLIC